MALPDVKPVVLAGERLLPVLEPLAPLLPAGGLQRGWTVTVSRSTSLALALLAGASAAGSWCAAVGMPSLGLAAAAEVGVVLERFPLVAAPADAGEWAWTVTTLLDAVDVVLVRPPEPAWRERSRSLPEPQARRLAVKARERSSVLLVCTPAWPGADVRLVAGDARWEGVGQGHGRLRARRVEVVAGGRGAAARERRVSLWLPGPDGGVAVGPSPVLGTVMNTAGA